jgi:hypothetical protein
MVTGEKEPDGSAGKVAPEQMDGNIKDAIQHGWPRPHGNVVSTTHSFIPSALPSINLPFFHLQPYPMYLKVRYRRGSGSWS